MPLEGEGKRLPSIAKGWEASCPNLLPALLPLSPQRLRICSVSEKNSSRDCPINQHKPQMGSHKAAKRCDRGFADPFLVTIKPTSRCPLAIYWTVSRRVLLGN